MLKNCFQKEKIMENVQLVFFAFLSFKVILFVKFLEGEILEFKTKIFNIFYLKIEALQEFSFFF